MKNYFLFTLILLISCTSTKQTQENHQKKVNGFALSENKSIPEVPSEVTPYKKELVLQVTNNLIEARGFQLLPAPNIVIKLTEGHGIAWMTEKEVGIEEKAYDICIDFGKDSTNCIAALMGHELAHYYQQHHIEQHFSFKYLDKKLNRADQSKIKNAAQAKQEAEADYLGGFLAYSAGYRPFGVLEKLLPKLYTSYGLQDSLDGYPPLPERIKNAQTSSQKAEELAYVFEMANHLLMLEDYKNAITYYEYILREGYTSREIHNNIGVCYFTEALHGWYEDVIYGYPIELDGEGRLLKTSKDIGDQNLQAGKLLKQAIKHFEDAFRLDESYATAKLNLACSYSLMDDIRKAEYHLIDAQTLAEKGMQKKVLIDCLILEGIIAAQNDNKEAAEEKFELAWNRGSLLAKYNIDKLNGDRVTYIGDDIGLSELYNTEKEKIEGIDIDKKIKPWHRHIDQENDGKKTIVRLHQTKKEYDDATLKGIKINDTQEALMKAYGNPDRVVAQRKREIFIYKQHKLLFTLLDGKVVKWSIFRKKPR